MARGLIASFLGMFVMACSGCGGGGGGSSTPAAVTTPQVQPTPTMQLTAFETEPVMTVGAPGAWDSSDVLNPSVMSFAGKLYDYYSGYDGTMWRTGIATSTDNGVTWTKKPTPVISPVPDPSHPMDTITANGSSVIFNGKVYHYYGQNSPSPTHAVIKLATSEDAEDFNIQPFIFDIGAPGAFDDSGVADPYVINVNGTLYMYYVGLSKATQRQTTGVATSTDGITWSRSSAAILPQGAASDFDYAAQGEPAVVFTGKFWYMLYVGNLSDGMRSIGWASSTDGLTWTKQGKLAIPQGYIQPWFSAMMVDPTMLPTGNNDGTYYVWFGGGTNPGNQLIHGQIGRFTVKLN